MTIKEAILKSLDDLNKLSNSIEICNHILENKYYEFAGKTPATGSTGIFEIRVEAGSDIYRAFSFFDKGQLIILVNGFQKKSQKTPKNELELAEKLKKQYFDEKDK